MRYFTFDDVKRAIWTAVQAFLGAFAVLAPGIWAAPNLNDAKAAFAAAVAAGVAAALSVLKNYVINVLTARGSMSAARAK